MKKEWTKPELLDLTAKKTAGGELWDPVMEDSTYYPSTSLEPV